MSWMSQIGALAATLIGFAKTSRTTQPTKASGSQTYALLAVGNLSESSLHGEITLKAPTLRATSLVPDLVSALVSRPPQGSTTVNSLLIRIRPTKWRSTSCGGSPGSGGSGRFHRALGDPG